MKRLCNPFLPVLFLAVIPYAGCAGQVAWDRVPHGVLARLASGETQDLIVVLDDAAVSAHAEELRKSKAIDHDDQQILSFKKERYALMKSALLSSLPQKDVELLQSFDLLPMLLLRFRSHSALRKLLAHPFVVRVYEDADEHLMPKE